MTITATPTDSIVVRIRKLIDKADNTTFDDEREALLAKATELMAQYQVDEAMVEAVQQVVSRGDLTLRSINLGSGPYSRARLSLLDSIARVFGCAGVTRVGFDGRVFDVHGYERDVILVEMLYTSLLLQGTSEMMKAEVPAGIATMTFRRSFLFGFADKVSSRLREEHNEAVRKATSTEEEAKSVALVMVDRRKDAQADVFRRYGKLRSLGRSKSVNGQGTDSGREAGGRADLSSNRSVKS